MKPTLYLVPNAGLCNRLRAIASAIEFCKAENRILKILWAKEELLNCYFHELFMPINIPNVTIEDVPKIPNKYQIQPTFNLKSRYSYSIRFFILKLYQKKVFQRTERNLNKQTIHKLRNTSGNILLHSCVDFYNQGEIKKFFIPIPSILLRIQENTIRFENTIGLHIRRTDNWIATKESPLELFEQAIKKEIRIDRKVNFYLATDSVEVKNQLKNTFGDEIITRENQLSRNNISGMTEAVIDLFSLSQTTKIYGSFWSSFSDFASDLGNIPLVKIKSSDRTAMQYSEMNNPT